MSNAQTLFIKANNRYNELEILIERVSRVKNVMVEDGLEGEYNDLMDHLDNALEVFGDFMPGLEMDAYGEEGR